MPELQIKKITAETYKNDVKLIEGNLFTFLTRLFRVSFATTKKRQVFSSDMFFLNIHSLFLRVYRSDANF